MFDCVRSCENEFMPVSVIFHRNFGVFNYSLCTVHQTGPHARFDVLYKCFHKKRVSKQIEFILILSNAVFVIIEGKNKSYAKEY